MTESYLTLLLMKPEYESIILVSIAQYKFLKKTIYIYIYICCPVGGGEYTNCISEEGVRNLPQRVSQIWH